MCSGCMCYRNCIEMGRRLSFHWLLQAEACDGTWAHVATEESPLDGSTWSAPNLENRHEGQSLSSFGHCESPLA